MHAKKVSTQIDPPLRVYLRALGNGAGLLFSCKKIALSQSCLVVSVSVCGCCSSDLSSDALFTGKKRRFVKRTSSHLRLFSQISPLSFRNWHSFCLQTQQNSHAEQELWHLCPPCFFPPYQQHCQSAIETGWGPFRKQNSRFHDNGPFSAPDMGRRRHASAPAMHRRQLWYLSDFWGCHQPWSERQILSRRQSCIGAIHDAAAMGSTRIM